MPLTYKHISIVYFITQRNNNNNTSGNEDEKGTQTKINIMTLLWPSETKPNGQGFDTSVITTNCAKKNPFSSPSSIPLILETRADNQEIKPQCSTR